MAEIVNLTVRGRSPLIITMGAIATGGTYSLKGTLHVFHDTPSLVECGHLIYAPMWPDIPPEYTYSLSSALLHALEQ